MRSIYDPIYRLRNWFSRLLTLPGWFDQELAESATLQDYTLAADGAAVSLTGGDAAFALVPFEVGYTAISRRRKVAKPIRLTHYRLEADAIDVSIVAMRASLRRGYAIVADGALASVQPPTADLIAARFVMLGAPHVIANRPVVDARAQRVVMLDAARVDAIGLRVSRLFVDESYDDEDAEWLLLQEVA